ncbi:RnaseH-domain-containing protein [Mycena leptocephala]|nr:RnaseH-domain-containing protein [Mycena leptocephala]
MVKAVKGLSKWEDQGWVGVANREALRALISELRARTAVTVFSMAEGNQDKASCGEAQSLALNGLQLPADANFSLMPRPKTTLRGAKLSTLTKAVANKAIKHLHKKAQRKAMDEHIKMVQNTIAQQYLHIPTVERIWKSIKHKDIMRQIRSFLWRCMHGSQRIWELVKKLWAKKSQNWPTLSVGAILGCSLGSFITEGRKSPATARLYKILISESTHLIWKLRCEFVVGREGIEPASKQEVHNRWVHTINERLKIDRNLTDVVRYGKQYYFAPSVVLETWKGVLEDEDHLPDNWLRGPGVLVGIAPKRSQRSPSLPPVGRRGRNR